MSQSGMPWHQVAVGGSAAPAAHRGKLSLQAGVRILREAHRLLFQGLCNQHAVPIAAETYVKNQNGEG